LFFENFLGCVELSFYTTRFLSLLFFENYPECVEWSFYMTRFFS
jgi:hypothetical protein